MSRMKKIALCAVFTLLFFALAAGIRYTTNDVSYALPGILFIGFLSFVLYFLCAVGENRPKIPKNKLFPLLAAGVASVFAAGIYLIYISII